MQIPHIADTLTKLANSWRDGQQWQAKPPGATEWVNLPIAYRPGWFNDTEYRQQPAN